MATTIIHKQSSTPSKVPLTTDLVAGELAINTADAKIFMKKDDNSVVQVGGSIPDGSITNVEIADGAVTDSKLATPKLNLSGGTLTGDLSGITPTQSQHLARKDYVDAVAPLTGNRAALTRTFGIDEEFEVVFSSDTSIANVMVEKEIATTNAESRTWLLNARNGFDIDDSAYDDTLTPSGTTGFITMSLGAGAFTTDDIGKTIHINNGKGVLLTTSKMQVIDDLDDTTIAASGEWTLFGMLEENNKLVASYIESKDIDVLNTGNNSTSNTINSDTFHVGIAISTDGFSFVVQGSGNNNLYQYTMTVPFDITTATYSGVNITSGDTTPTGVYFSPDGTKLFQLGTASDTISAYELATPFDISTNTLVTTYSRTNPEDIHFSPDGTKMYTTGYDSVYAYELATPWDLDTMTFRNSVSTPTLQDSFGLTLNPVGTKMFIALGNSSTAETEIWEYTLTTAFDVSTAVDTGNRWNVSNWTDDIYGMDMSKDGKHLFYVWHDISTSTFYIRSLELEGADVITQSKSLAVTNVAGALNTTYWTEVEDIVIADKQGDGFISYALSDDNKNTFFNFLPSTIRREIVRLNTTSWEYNNSNPGFDISAATYSGDSISISQISPTGISFNPNGTKMYILGTSGNDVIEYDLSTGFDVTTAVYLSGFTAGWQFVPEGIDFNNDGTKMYMLGNDEKVHEFQLSTGFDITTATYPGNFYDATQYLTTPTGMVFNNDGTKIFISDSSTNSIHEYILTIGFDLSTMSHTNSFDINNEDTNAQGVTFNTDGTKMYMAGDSNNAVFEYTLTSGFDTTTATYSNNMFYIGGEASSPRGITFSSDGTKMFVTDDVSNNAVAYNTNTNVVDVWVSSTVNTLNGALLESAENPANRMFSTDTDTLSNLNMPITGTTMDMAVMTKMTGNDVNKNTEFSTALIQYNGMLVNQSATVNIDYQSFQETDQSIFIKNLSAESEIYSIRVI